MCMKACNPATWRVLMNKLKRISYALGAILMVLLKVRGYWDLGLR